MSDIEETKNQKSLMFHEATEAGVRIGEQLIKNKPLIESVAEKIRAYKPHAVMTVGRGSSDHAGVFAKYLIEK